MKIQFLIVSLLALCHGYHGRVLAGPFGGRIVNGVDVGVGEIPYQVSLQYKSSFHFCGGSILNKKYVITAAHCVDGQSPEMIKVVADTVKLSQPNQTHFVEKLIVHKGYDDYDSWRNDIALIKIKTEFVNSSTLGFIPLPKAGLKVPDNAVAVVSGWGRLWQGGASPNHLQKAEILIANQTYCRSKYVPLSLNVHDTQICAHDPVEETGSCHGDSGGPLTVNGTLVGLVSWAMGCALTDYPTVYTRVSEFVDWIKLNAV